MFVSIRRYKVNSKNLPEITRRAQAGFVPIIKGSPGFVAYYGLDTGEGTAATITIFQDKAGAEESNRRAAAWVKENLAGLLDGAPEITVGDVLWSA
jgi:hypothetical protein